MAGIGVGDGISVGTGGWHVTVGGECDYPSVDDVEEGVTFASGSLTGVFGVPAQAEVLFGVGYGANDTEFTGTLNANPIVPTGFKSQFDILDMFYPILNVSHITDTIDGRIYRNRKPPGSQVRDIVLLNLPISGNEKGDLQRGTFIINCFAKSDITTGTPDEVSLKATAAAVNDVIESYSNSSSSFFTLENIGGVMIPDESDNTMYYYNIRVNYFIQTE